MKVADFVESVGIVRIGRFFYCGESQKRRSERQQLGNDGEGFA